MKQTTIKYVPGSKKSFGEKVLRKFREYHREQYLPFDHKEIAFAAKDEKGKWVGGLTGRTYWGWLFVNLLWVDKKFRKEGLGTQLLQKAESLAKKRGCKYVHLDTFTFQAPEFYKKLGFKRFGLLKPFPRGASRYYFYKKIK